MIDRMQTIGCSGWLGRLFNTVKLSAFQHSGELTALRTIASAATLEVSFLRPLEARIRSGRGCLCDVGVILVITRSERE
jgi:hypothetical protein